MCPLFNTRSPSITPTHSNYRNRAWRGIFKPYLDQVQEASLNWVMRFMQSCEPELCSDIGERVARTIGPYLPISQVARDNLALAFPQATDEERRVILMNAWGNIGRVIAEFPHLPRFREGKLAANWEITGQQHIAEATGPHGPPLFFSGHLANWELILPIARAKGFNVAGVYRASNNLVVDRIIQKTREAGVSRVIMFPKGSRGARGILRHLAAGGSVGLLVDQKMNDGLEVPFFQRSAWTAPSIAHLAMRFNRKIIPVRVMRTGSLRYKLICEPALHYSSSGNRTKDEYTVMEEINRTLERWINETPSDWLWFHRRWRNDNKKI